MQSKHNTERRAKASSILSQHGYGKMQGLSSPHAAHAAPKSTKPRMKLASGGAAKGERPHDRLDRKARAHGGRNKGKKEPHVSVNVINAGPKPSMPMPGGGMPPHPPMAPPPSPMAAAPSPMAPKPPMAPPGGMPPRPFKAGGPVRTKMDIPHLQGGSGGGKGRLEKAAHEAKRK